MPRCKHYAILCVILFAPALGAVARAEPLPAPMRGGDPVAYDSPVGAEGDICLPEGAFCLVTGVRQWTIESDLGFDAEDASAVCCSGNCQIEACTESIPGSCFGTCAPEPTHVELRLCSSGANCDSSEFCTTDAEPCALSPSHEFCIGVCLPTQSN